MADVAVRLENVSAAYGAVRALDDVSLEARAGTVTALLGANGAGKTTTLRVIAGLQPASQGSLSISGTAVKAGRGVIRPGVALSPEGRRLFPKMSVRDNLLTGGFSLAGGRALDQAIDEVLGFIPFLRERLHDRAGTLSGGQQTMVAIGRALMRRPEVLLLDEPTLGLSPRATGEIAKLIASIAESGTTIVLVEQNAAVALTLASYAYVLDSGRISMADAAARIRERDDLVASYLGAEFH